VRRVLGILASIITVITAFVAVVLALGIILIVLGANKDNGLVIVVIDTARFVAGPFHTLFDLEALKQRIAINWGIATAIYAALGLFVAAQLRNAAASRAVRK
jgi:hypothetical protein